MVETKLSLVFRVVVSTVHTHLDRGGVAERLTHVEHAHIMLTLFLKQRASRFVFHPGFLSILYDSY